MTVVNLVAYDPSWPSLFRKEAGRLLPLLKERVRSFEHVGSTSVPGLSAKATIDMMGDAPTVEDAEACIPILEGAGYSHTRNVDADWPDRRFFQYHQGLQCLYQIHLVQRDGRFWDLYIRFRDALRANPSRKGDYEALKRRLAEDYREDVGGYTRAKSGFISETLKAAGW